MKRQHHRRGSVFITALWIIIALTAVALVLCREMIVESMAAAQHISQARADAAELGVEQLVVSIMAEELVVPGYRDSLSYEQRSIGDCYYWIITTNPDDETLPAYGLTDEAGKLDLNSATDAMLDLLPNMEDDYVAASIVDWRDADDNPTNTLGAESTYYQALSPAYTAKDAPFESTGELALVAGVADAVDATGHNTLLYGADLNRDGVIEPGELAVADPGLAFENSMLGIMPFVTVYGVRATNVPASATTSTTGTTGGTTGGIIGTTTGVQPPVVPGTLDPDGNPLADVNATSTTALTTVLQTYLPSKQSQILAAMRTTTGGGAAGGRGGAAGGGATATKFTSIWDWAVKMQQSAQMTSDDFTLIYPYLTCSSTTTVVAGAGAGTATQTAKVNIMTAKKAVLMCLPLFTEEDAQAIIDYRETSVTDLTQATNIAWLLDVVPTATLRQAGTMITGQSTCYSADIVTVTRDGRAFKRTRIVVDASTGLPQIVYRRDMTSEGWPLDPEIRNKLRRGEELGAGATDPSNPGSRLSIGVH